jgi:hypothetical protein
MQMVGVFTSKMVNDTDEQGGSPSLRVDASGGEESQMFHVKPVCGLMPLTTEESMLYTKQKLLG